MRHILFLTSIQTKCNVRFQNVDLCMKGIFKFYQLFSLDFNLSTKLLLIAFANKDFKMMNLHAFSFLEWRSRHFL